MTANLERLLGNISTLVLLGCTSGRTVTPPAYAWNSSSGSWSQPATPPPPRPLPPAATAPTISMPPRGAATTLAPVPNGWVNYGGLILPSVPGLTVPLSNPARGPAASALISPPSSPSSISSVPNGWVNWNGILVPAIPGFTAPIPNQNSGAPGIAAGSMANVPSTPAGSCGKVVVRNRAFALDCMTPHYAEIPWASFLALDRRLFNSSYGLAGATPLPATVDHRQDGTEGPVRDQGEVGACTAFSFVSAIDHALLRATGNATPISVMHVWSRYHQPLIEAAASNNLNKNLTAETNWPFDEAAACAWDCQDRGTNSSACADVNVTCSTPNPVQVSFADAKPNAKVVDVTRIDIADFEGIKAVLAKGQDVWFGMHVNQEQFSQIPSRPNVVLPDGDFRSGAGHAMLLAGYAVQPTGTFYLIHNSWSKDWGDNGYAWIAQETLQRNILSAYVVEAVPAATPGPSPAAPAPQQPACPSNLKPDSVNGNCVPPCSDGSPRHANTCPVPNQCPAGYVNLSGACVFAAPNIAGQDPKTGIWYSCSSGGCSYMIPRGQAGCNLQLCEKSCPAPKYHLAVSQGGLSCVE